jgi:preprotein translocase subunit SecG
MPNLEITTPVLITAIICITIITVVLLFRSKKVKIDKTGSVELELVKKQPETKETKNETNIV